MIDIENAVREFKRFISQFKSSDELGYHLKETHTYGVMKYSRVIAEQLHLSEEDIALAELIALLHDIGRFEEMKVMNSFDGIKFDHAAHGAKILFEDGMIERFTSEKSYYQIIEKAISNHNKLEIESGLDDRALLHAKIIRDSDKLDNFEVKCNRPSEHLFKNTVGGIEEFENSIISDEVYNSMVQQKCVNLRDRKVPLDYYVCVLGFMYDLNFNVSFNIVKEHDYVNKLIDKFQYKLPETKERMECIRKLLLDKVEHSL